MATLCTVTFYLFFFSFHNVRENWTDMQIDRHMSMEIRSLQHFKPLHGKTELFYPWRDLKCCSERISRTLLQNNSDSKTWAHLLQLTHKRTFNGPFSGTTRVSRYQKGKTNLDFTEARDSEWPWHQLDHMQVCTSLQTDNHGSTPPLCFYRPDALPAAEPTASKDWRQQLNIGNYFISWNKTAT